MVAEVVVQGVTGLAQSIDVRGHHLKADEPTDAGGTDTGPTPYDLLAAALGACTSMTISMSARKRKFPLDSVTVRVRHSKVHADDCAASETKDVTIDRLDRTIELVGALSEEQRQHLLGVADRCPVHRTLKSEIDIQTSLLP